MAIQLYSKVFQGDTRQKALAQVNEFLLKNGSIDVVNIDEYWDTEGYCLTVYFKEYI